MKTLILTCNTGQGHTSTAYAVKDAFDAHGSPCDIADALAFLSPLVSRVVCRAHTRIYRYIPGAFSACYQAAENHGEVFERRSPVYQLMKQGVGKLRRHILEGGYDVIVCTHAFSALMATALREKHPELEAYYAFVATDYTCSPSVKECKMDAFFIPDASLAEDFSSKGLPADRLIPLGLPVRREFLSRLPHEEAAAATGLDPERRRLLMMCGSMGCGPMEELTDHLAREMPADTVVTVVCGTNTALCRRLSRRFAACDNVEILGYTNNISALMDSSTVYLTKPGGISVTEAAAKGLPMVLVNAVAGCEEPNLHYNLNYGMAKTAETPRELAALCVRLLSDEPARLAMQDNIAAHAHPDAAERIYEHLHAATCPRA